MEGGECLEVGGALWVERRLWGEQMGEGVFYPQGGEDFVDVADVVVLQGAESLVFVLRKCDGEVGGEEACEVGGPDELFLALAVEVDGEEGGGEIES